METKKELEVTEILTKSKDHAPNAANDGNKKGSEFGTNTVSKDSKPPKICMANVESYIFALAGCGKFDR